MQHHLRRMVALGFQQQWIHIRLTGDACSLRLHGLCSPDLKSIGCRIGVQCHILRLEGCRLITILTEDTTEGRSHHALADIAACTCKHQWMKSSVHRSRPGLSCAASLKVRIALQSVAARLLPPLRPSTMIFGISLKGFTMCLDSRT